jgi:hypothetical protein
MRRSQTAVPAATPVRGRARLRLAGRTFYLGRFGSPEARRLQDKIVGVYLANGRTLPADFDPAGQARSPMPPDAEPAPAAIPAAVIVGPAQASITVGELCLRWIAWIQAERLAPGRDTSLLDGARQATYRLRRRASMLASEFGPRALAEARLALANEPCRRGSRTKAQPASPPQAPPAKPRKNARKPKPPKPPRYRSRATVNDTIGRIRQMFRWAVARELLGPDRLQALQALDPYTRDRPRRWSGRR